MRRYLYIAALRSAYNRETKIVTSIVEASCQKEAARIGFNKTVPRWRHTPWGWQAERVVPL